VIGERSRRNSCSLNNVADARPAKSALQNDAQTSVRIVSRCSTMPLRIYARVKLQLGTVDALQLAIIPSSQYRNLTLVQLESTEPRRACTYTDVRTYYTVHRAKEED